MVGRDDVTGTSANASDAVDGLFRSEHAAMVRLAVLLVDDPRVAEEVVQDAFAAVAPRINDLDQPGAYLRTTVVNGARAVLRRREVERRLTPQAGESPIEMPSELVELHDALQVLTDDQRAVIVLRYLSDLPDEDIAAHLGCRRSTVRSHAKRALSRLREELS